MPPTNLSAEHLTKPADCGARTPACRVHTRVNAWPGRPLSRRTLLRGLGAAISLPLLDAMVPAFASPTSPLRLAFIYVPNGIYMDHWTPASEGPGFELPRIL